MNSQIRNLILLALAAALPLSVAAQSGTSGSTSGTGTAGSSGSGSSTRTGTSGTSTTDRSALGTAGSSALSGSAGIAGITRVDQTSLKQQFTATDLIGKEVYDNGGKKVGEVKDVVLGSAAGSHLAMAFGSEGSASSGLRSTSDNTRQTGSTGTSASGSRMASAATGSTSGTGSTSSGMTGTTSGTTGSTSGSSTSGSLGRDLSSAYSAVSGLAGEPAAIVSLGGFMGMGDNLLRVPLSQLNYDSTEERLTLAIDENQLSSITDESRSQKAAE